MLLRPFTLADAPAAFRWLGDSEVMRFIPSGPDASMAATGDRLARYIQHVDQHGFGKWAVTDRETGQLMGDAGFSYFPDGERVELGYRLSREHWGKGLATELARCWLEHATEFLGPQPVYAFAHPENTASLQILRSANFCFLREEQLYGWRVPVFIWEPSETPNP